MLRPVDVDDEDLEDEKEENADRHGVPDEDETDNNDDYCGRRLDVDLIQYNICDVNILRPTSSYYS